MIQQSFKALVNTLCWVVLISVPVFALSGCAALIQPNISHAIAEIKPGQYALDKDHATVLFKVNHMGFSSFVGRFNSFDASLNFNAESVEDSSLEAVVDMASVDVNNAKFEKALRGRFWLDVKAHPKAYYKTRSAKKIDESTIIFYGDLTFLGETAPLELRVKINGAANNILTQKYTLGFSAEAVILRSRYGLDRYVPTVGDEVTLEIHAEFQRH